MVIDKVQLRDGMNSLEGFLETFQEKGASFKSFLYMSVDCGVIFFGRMEPFF